MSKHKGIEERLQKRADDELEKMVSTIIDGCKNSLDKIIPGSWATYTSVKIKLQNDELFTRSVEALLADINAAVFDKLIDQYREKTVKAFMEKVDTLHDQLDELRDEINYSDR